MKYTLKLFIIIVTIGLLQACSSVFTDKSCTEGIGDVITEEQQLTGTIQKVYSGIAGNIFITQGNEQKVLVQAQANIIPLLNLTIVDNELRIEFKDDNCVDNTTINIFVTTPTINQVTLAGSGNIEGQNKWDTSNLEIVLSGSGNIKANINSNDVNTSVAGSGNIVLTGNATKQNLRLTGSGNYRAFGLVNDQAVINLTGSGNVEVQTKQTLTVTISGSGQVAYKGSPSITQNITGSGKLTNAN